MIGLLQKDFFILWHAYKKNLALVAVLYTGMALLLDMSFMLFMMCWIMGFYIIGSLTIDNSAKWDLYAACLPVSRGQLVGAKFLIMLAALAAGGVYGCLVSLAQTLINDAPLLENLASTGAVMLFCIVYFGITLVLSYKFGPEKARSVMLLVIAGFSALILAGVRMGFLSSAAPDVVTAVFEAIDLNPMPYLAGIVVFCILIYLACWAISTAIYSKKEF